MRTTILCFLLVAVLAGCGAAASTTTGSSPGRQERLITADEIKTTTARNAQEAIEQLRPRWLSRFPLPLYVNDVTYSLSLRDLLTQEILNIEFLSSADATTRFGTNHSYGALVVKTK
ncbi:MAG TPA: hypothetical protein VII11_01870 [Bacteroidota bacterium]